MTFNLPMKRNIFLAAIAVFIILTLSGCATVNRVLDFGAAVNDEAVDSAQFTLCNAASIGSIRREFDTPEKVETWKRLCANDTDFTPATN